MSESRESMQFDLSVFRSVGQSLIERAKSESSPADRDRLLTLVFETLEDLLDQAARAAPVHH